MRIEQIVTPNTNEATSKDLPNFTFLNSYKTALKKGTKDMMKRAIVTLNMRFLKHRRSLQQ